MADGDNDQRYPFHWRHDKKTVGTFEKLTISTVKTVRSSIWVVVVSLRIHSNKSCFRWSRQTKLQIAALPTEILSLETRRGKQYEQHLRACKKEAKETAMRFRLKKENNVANINPIYIMESLYYRLTISNSTSRSEEWCEWTNSWWQLDHARPAIMQ